VVASEPYSSPNVTDLLSGLGAVPSFASKVTTIPVLAVHLAWSVWFDGFVTVVPGVTCVPPVASVNHPTNVKPVLVATGRPPYEALNVTVLLSNSTSPPGALKLTTTPPAAH